MEHADDKKKLRSNSLIKNQKRVQKNEDAVVDDSSTMRRIIKNTLNHLGYKDLLEGETAYKLGIYSVRLQISVY